MRMGSSTIPRMRVPALLKGQLILFDLASLQGQWGILSFLPPFEFGEAIFLNQYHRTIQKEGARLLGVLPLADPLLDPRLLKAKILRFPLLADPLQRLRRVFRLGQQSSTNRCISFIIDPKRVIRYHLVHQLNWRGQSFLSEILKHCQNQYAPSLRPSLALRVITNIPQAPQPQKIRISNLLLRTV